MIHFLKKFATEILRVFHRISIGPLFTVGNARVTRQITTISMDTGLHSNTGVLLLVQFEKKKPVYIILLSSSMNTYYTSQMTQ